MTSSPCCVYDFTVSSANLSQEFVSNILKEIAKKWAFQLERGESGYEHYQGRMSLKLKKRDRELIALLQQHGAQSWHVSITSTANRDNCFYVLKDETRIDGPWKDDDQELYIPRQYKGLSPYPWQRTAQGKIENTFNAREINCILSPRGCEGKSTFAAIMSLKYGCIDIPPVRDSITLMQLACNICMDRNIRSPKAFFIDLPRAMNKENLATIFTAIEEMKKGRLYETRYHFKEFWIDSPHIWVFTNTCPDISSFSPDRWVFWTIDSSKELVRAYPHQFGDIFGSSKTRTPDIPDDLAKPWGESINPMYETPFA